jgi:aspartate ammonia-lyase
MQSMAPFVRLSNDLRGFCLDLTRIANDFRLLASGPTTGFDEVILPAVQPGSSIMPGKVNPVIAEMTNMVCFQVLGYDTTVAYAAQAGQLELNVMMPVIAHNLHPRSRFSRRRSACSARSAWTGSPPTRTSAASTSSGRSRSPPR